MSAPSKLALATVHSVTRRVGHFISWISFKRVFWSSSMIVEQKIIDDVDCCIDQDSDAQPSHRLR
ncbi:MAG: hypothetical protein V7K48_04015 [Nostoc sp.]|uniref:hypothetical protein n=1 Tax=Nostoc sp. TaxID=1180 RepID=UPI002FF5CC27